jgi:hypothetical protein
MGTAISSVRRGCTKAMSGPADKAIMEAIPEVGNGSHLIRTKYRETHFALWVMGNINLYQIEKNRAFASHPLR